MENPNPLPGTHAKLSIFSVLGRTFSIIIENPLVFLSLALIGALPSMLMWLAMPSMSHLNPSYGKIIPILLFSLVVAATIMGAISYAAFQAADDIPCSIGEALSASFAKILSLIMIGLLVFFLICGGTMLIVATGIGKSFGVGVLIGMGIVFFCMAAVCIPACVLEDLGPLASLNRSAELTKGNRLYILLLLIIVLVGGFLVNVLTGLLGGILGYVGGDIPGLLLTIIATISSILVNAYSYTLLGVVYYDLYAFETGSTGLGAATAVFD